MTFMNKIHRRQLLATALAACALPLVRPAWAQAPRSLRIGNQKGWLSILKARGTLEKRLALLGVNISWTEFMAGPAWAAAL